MMMIGLYDDKAENSDLTLIELYVIWTELGPVLMLRLGLRFWHSCGHR